MLFLWLQVTNLCAARRMEDTGASSVGGSPFNPTKTGWGIDAVSGKTLVADLWPGGPYRRGLNARLTTWRATESAKHSFIERSSQRGWRVNVCSQCLSWTFKCCVHVVTACCCFVFSSSGVFDRKLLTDSKTLSSLLTRNKRWKVTARKRERVNFFFLVVFRESCMWVIGYIYPFPLSSSTFL